MVDFLGDLERDLLDRLGVRGEGDLVGQTGFSCVNSQDLKMHHIVNLRKTDEPTYLLEDFLLLARGDSLCVERDMVSLEYEQIGRAHV